MKKNWKKRILTGLLTCAMVMVFMPMSAFAADLSDCDVWITEPTAGMAPSTAGNTDTPDVGYRVDGVQWFEIVGLGASPVTGNFEEGKTYGAQVTVTADEGNLFKEPVNGTINREEADVTVQNNGGTVLLNKKYGPLPAAEQDPGSLTFLDADDYDIPSGMCGTPIEEFSVADGVSGGNEPYNFDLLDGPDWLQVSADGTVSGTRPDTEQEETEATVRVMDDGADAATITIKVGEVWMVPVQTAYFTLTTEVIGGHGTISEGKVRIPSGTTETIIFKPDAGYEIDVVKVNGEEKGVLANVLDVTIESDTKVTVTYKKIGTPTQVKPVKPNTPNTGDTNRPVLWTIVLCGACVALVAARKKYQK